MRMTNIEAELRSRQLLEDHLKLVGTSPNWFAMIHIFDAQMFS
jgi:hypothetical protein